MNFRLISSLKKYSLKNTRSQRGPTSGKLPAPIMKKAGTISTGKSGTSGHVGKSGLKFGSTLNPGPKLPSVASASGKSSGSYITPKSNKSSSSFGIIWLPGRKRNNKHKDTVYNSHRNERPRERAPSMYNIMSGDSSNQQTLLKKKEEESDFSVSERSGNASVAIAGAGVVASSELPPDIVSANPEDKIDKEFIKHDQEDSKEAAGDTKDIGNVDKDNLEHKRNEKPPEAKTEKGVLEDNVDSVFLRSPPPHKTRSQASTVEEEDCGIKCLYYTLQCCDCVLM